uniref:ANK_REP_REGION domain-containing protein n=1 Tax=Macrostomum lignano TaxID=282301 RepID=A0A1I8F5H4_9PLAT
PAVPSSARLIPAAPSSHATSSRSPHRACSSARIHRGMLRLASHQPRAGAIDGRFATAFADGSRRFRPVVEDRVARRIQPKLTAASPPGGCRSSHPGSGRQSPPVVTLSGAGRTVSGCLTTCWPGAPTLAGQSNFDGKRGANTKRRRPTPWPPLIGWLRVARVPVDPLKRADWTPLMLASAKPFEPMLRLLLSHGARPGLVNKDGWTPLHLACRVGQPACADRPARNGRTPAHTLALHGHAGLTPGLCPSCCPARLGAGQRSRLVRLAAPAMEACKAGSLACLRVILDIVGGVGADRWDSAGYTCLHHAARLWPNRAVPLPAEACFLTPALRTRLAAPAIGVTPLQLACREATAAPAAVGGRRRRRSEPAGRQGAARAEDYARLSSGSEECRAVVAEALRRLRQPQD